MLFNLNGHGNKQTHIPFQLKLKCLSVVATRRTLLQHTPPHLPAGGLWCGCVCQAFECSHGTPTPLCFFSVLFWAYPKRFTKCLFKNSTTNNELCHRRHRGRRPICIILLVNTRYEVSHAHRPPATDVRPSYKCRHSLDLDFRLGIKYIYIWPQRKSPGSPCNHLFINTNLFSVIKTQNFAVNSLGTPGVSTAWAWESGGVGVEPAPELHCSAIVPGLNLWAVYPVSFESLFRKCFCFD